jgi:hypothetical protein
VDSLYSEAELELDQLEKAAELVFTNNVRIQFRAVFSENALRMVRGYKTVNE